MLVFYNQAIENIPMSASWNLLQNTEFLCVFTSEIPKARKLTEPSGMCSTAKSLNHWGTVFIVFAHCQDKVPAQGNLKTCSLRFVHLTGQGEAYHGREVTSARAEAASHSASAGRQTVQALEPAWLTD